MAEHAPAKINLALHVTGHRPDGFHLIESLAVFTRHGDRVTVAAASEDSFSTSGPFGAEIPLDGGNLVVRARDMLRRAHLLAMVPPSVLPDISPSRGEIEPAACLSPIASVAGIAVAPKLPISPLEGEMSGRTEGGRTSGRKQQPVSIHLTKHLPVASGIGGGSSDAAATLTALNRLCRFGLTSEQLAKIGRDLGADVPMCLYTKPLIARGIGEQIEPAAGFPALAMVLVNPGVPVSTPEVFSALTSRENPGLPPLPLVKDEGQLAFGDICRWLASTRNDLQAPAVSIAPAIAQSLEALTSAGAGFARMSGSGATCFGLFETSGEAARAAAEIQARQPGWWVVATESIASKDPADDAA
nr:4-(cytidine 5'-diphospho)-2-C-methyl-D-erythritol kinase [Mesorhizobium camelthorni]